MPVYLRDGSAQTILRAIPLKPIARKTLSAVDFSVNWATDRNWKTKLLDKRKVTQLNINFVRKC